MTTPDATAPDTTAPNTSTAATVVRPFGLLYRVILRHTVTRPRLLGLGSLAALLILIGWAAGRSDLETRRAVLLMGNLGLAVLLPIGALILASAALSDLRDDKTLVYLWLRPMRAWVVPTAAVAASATALMPITVVAAVVSGVLMDAGSEVVVGAVLAMVAGTVTYSAVFVTFGLYVKRTLLWGLVYVLIWEGFIAGAGQGVARFAVRAYTRSIIADVADVDIDLAEFSLATSIIVCLCVSAATLWLGIRRYSRMDVD